MVHIVWLPVIFIAYTGALYYLAAQLEVSDSSTFNIPSNVEELATFSKDLSKFAQDHSNYVLLLFCMTYIWKQTFAIPGSFLLNLLAGALYGVKFGLILACILTSIGATNCYLWSNYFARKYILKYLSHKLEPLSSKIRENQSSLLVCMMSLRLIPMTPNWLLNLASPVLDVPIHIFFVSVFFGLLPYNYVCVQSGTMLSTIHSTSDVLTFSVISRLVAVALLLIAPSLIVSIVRRVTRKKNV